MEDSHSCRRLVQVGCYPKYPVHKFAVYEFYPVNRRDPGDIFRLQINGVTYAEVRRDSHASTETEWTTGVPLTEIDFFKIVMECEIANKELDDHRGCLCLDTLASRDNGNVGVKISIHYKHLGDFMSVHTLRVFAWCHVDDAVRQKHRRREIEFAEAELRKSEHNVLVQERILALQTRWTNLANHQQRYIDLLRDETKEVNLVLRKPVEQVVLFNHLNHRQKLIKMELGPMEFKNKGEVTFYDTRTGIDYEFFESLNDGDYVTVKVPKEMAEVFIRNSTARAYTRISDAEFAFDRGAKFEFNEIAKMLNIVKLLVDQARCTAYYSDLLVSPEEQAQVHVTIMGDGLTRQRLLLPREL